MKHRWIALLCALTLLVVTAIRAQDSYPPEVDIAMDDLNARLRTNYRLGALVNWYWEERVFPDASMGCPVRGVEYAQVETGGFAIFLTLGSQIYEYRAAINSNAVSFCGSRRAQPQPTPVGRATRTPGNWEYSAVRGQYYPALAWSPTGRWIAVAGAASGATGTIYLYTPDDLDLTPTELTFAQPVTALDLWAGANGVYLVTGGAGGALGLLPTDPTGGALIEMRTEALTTRVNAVGISPDGSVIASSHLAADPAAPAQINLWNATNGELLTSIEAPSPITSLDFGGALLAAGTATGRLLLVDYATGTTIAEIGQSTDAAALVSFSPVGTPLAVASGTQVTLWDVTDPANINAQQTFTADYPIHTLTFNPDGTRLATAGGDDNLPSVSASVIRVWDVTTGEAAATLRAHTNTVNAIAYSPDGTRMASVSADGTLRVWRFGPIP